MSYSVLLVQAKNTEHFPGVRDGFWNQLYISSHSGAAFKSNITHCLIPFLHFNNNGINRSEQEQRNGVTALVAGILGKETDTCPCLNIQAPHWIFIRLVTISFPT